MQQEIPWDRLKTEPQSISGLAEWFRLDRKTMRLVLDDMTDAEKCGGLWRVPLYRMPPQYLVSVGIIKPVGKSGEV